MTRPNGQAPAEIVGLVLAAGSGSRLGLGNKAFLEMHGTTLLRVAVRLLSTCTGRVLVGVPAESLELARTELADLAEVCPGGGSRHETICRLFERCVEEIVVIHDVARPFATSDLLLRVVEAARADGAAAPVVVPTSRVVCVEDGYVRAFVSRAQGHLGQTPQAFARTLLDRALRAAPPRSGEDPSPAELAVWLGIPVRAVPGEEMNFKVTTPLEWEMVKALSMRSAVDRS